MFELYDTVRLKEENTELGIKPSNIGAIVDVLGNGEAYTVEFVDENGDTIEDALFAEFSEDELELVKPA